MLKTARMSKVELVGPRTKAYAIIDVLHRLKLMHFVDHAKTQDLDIGSPLEGSDLVAELLLKVKGLLSLSSQEKKTSLAGFLGTKLSFEEIHEKVDVLVKKYEALQEKIKEKEHLLVEKESLLEQLDVLNALYLDVEEYRPYGSLSLFLGTIKERNGIKKYLDAVTNTYSLYVSDYKGKKLIALFVDKKFTEKIATVLQGQEFQEIDVSSVLHLNGTPLNHVNHLTAECDALQKEKGTLTLFAQKLLAKPSSFLFRAEQFLTSESEKHEAPLRFAATKDAFIARGWVPTQKLEALQSALQKESQGKYHIELKEIEKKDNVPIVFDNPRLTKPLEFFMHLYTLPRYGEMDPTFFLFLSFPFFFGLMLGDVGYGFVTLILFWYLKKKVPSLKMLLSAMMYCSYSTIFFGLLFGEYFGYEHVGEGLGTLLSNLGLPLERMILHGDIAYNLPRVLSRLHAHMDILGNSLPTVLVIGAILGFFHVNTALFLGFLNELKSHGLKHAIFAKLSWYLLQIAIAILALSSLGMVEIPMYVGYILFGITVVMLYIGEGIQGLIEIPAIFSNMLSYLRLGAVSLASVGLAVVVNENLAGPFLAKGGLWIIVGLLIFVVGHIINIALGIMGPFLHSIRLHYVEFFSKFFHGGGITFVPFGEKKK